MKHSRAAVHRKVHKLPVLRFEQQTLTSYGGLVLLQALLNRLELKDRVRACFSHLHVAPIFGHHLVVLLLVVHLFLGYREFRDARYYCLMLVLPVRGRGLPREGSHARPVFRARAEPALAARGGRAPRWSRRHSGRYPTVSG
jgi:hypothetical protein